MWPLHGWSLEGILFLLVVSWCFLRTLLLDCGLEALSILSLLIQLILHNIGSHEFYHVQHVLSKIGDIIWKDICVLIRLREVCEGDPLMEGKPVDLHIFILDIFTKHIRQGV